MTFSNPRTFICILFLVLGLSGAVDASNGKSQYALRGKTMGTYYSVKFISDEKADLQVWEKRVKILLSEINKKMSMFDPQSELSLFNLHAQKNPMTVSKEFLSILLTGRQLFDITGGAWDGTVKPLVDLWGFGVEKNMRRIPAEDDIRRALSSTGFHYIDILPPKTVIKNRPVTLDLGSIAKGYGVDKLAAMFQSFGINDVLVEIGGELSASGRNLKGRPWSVGITRPAKKSLRQNIYTAVRLDSRSIATSGDYRNFFKKNGKAYSHIISPKTGRPVKTDIVSASVISGTCTFADGLATALMVMDLQKGLDTVNALENTECLVITHRDGHFKSHMSAGFKHLVVE